MGSVAEVDRLQRALGRRLPDATITVDAPDTLDGVWWVDVEREGRIASVEWNAHRGYGVAAPGGGYGERADAVVQDADDAAELVVMALTEAVARH